MHIYMYVYDICIYIYRQDRYWFSGGDKIIMNINARSMNVKKIFSLKEHEENLNF